MLPPQCMSVAKGDGKPPLHEFNAEGLLEALVDIPNCPARLNAELPL